MKFKYKILLLFLFLMLPVSVFAQQEVEVIPYKIANPTDNFTIETGKEYAKLVSLAAAISKDITIIPHEKVDDAFKRLSLNSQRIITEDNIIAIGKMGNAENVLIGTLFKTIGNYTSESILYSLKNRKIISKSRVSSGNLFKLAEEEMNEIFYSSPNKKRIMNERLVDAVIMVDLSYKIAIEWPSIKNGIKELADSISENWNLNTVVHIVPFSDKYTVLSKYTGLKSLPSINEKLSQLIPAGSASAKSFQNALDYSVKNSPWRRTSEKILIIISNSENIQSKFYEQYAISAKAKKISINTISLGLVKENALEMLKEFSIAGSGRHYSVAYHQRTFNEKGNPVDIFYQDGRIFQSLLYDNSWKNGLFEEKQRKQSVIEKPKPFLSEIFHNEKKYNVNPYNLLKHCPALSQLNIINSEKLENNVEFIMQKMGANFESNFTKIKYKKSIAKAQITDGKIIFWVQIKEDKELNVLKRNMSANSYFPLGVVIKKSSNDPYGIMLQPDLFITEFRDGYIPDLIKTNLSKIIKDPDYFTSQGLLTPPIWFIDAKVEKIENLRRDYDIREHGR